MKAFFSSLLIFLAVTSVAPPMPSYITTETTLVRGNDGVADPCMFYYDGNFYLTKTGSSRVPGYCAKTVDGLRSVSTNSAIVYDSALDPAVKQYFGQGAKINGTWSPEIHRFTTEDFPDHPEYAGFYMFVALRQNTGDSSAVRMTVLKSTEENNPAAVYGYPVPGEAYGTPHRSKPLLQADGSEYTEWGCGQSLLRIPSGKYKGVYATWVAEEGRGTAGFEQKLMIAKLKSPWQLDGEPQIYCRPTQYWETIGGGLSGKTYFPRVVEGGTAVYGEHGEIYMIYCGSGYWTNYGLGQLTLRQDANGDYLDPTDYDAWVKYENNPTFSVADADGRHYLGIHKQGAGHAFFFTDAAGNGWFSYHAYPYNDSDAPAVIDGIALGAYTRHSARRAYLEPYFIDYASISDTAPYGLVRMGVNNNGKPAETNTPLTLCIREPSAEK